MLTVAIVASMITLLLVAVLSVLSTVILLSAAAVNTKLKCLSYLGRDTNIYTPAHLRWSYVEYMCQMWY